MSYPSNPFEISRLAPSEALKILTDSDDACYKFIAALKWYKGFRCNSKTCRNSKANRSDYDQVERKTKGGIVTYCRKCKHCQEVETPTAKTNLHSIEINIRLFFELVYTITNQRSEGRINNEQLFVKFKDKHGGITKNHLAELRHMIQHFMFPWRQEEYIDNEPFCVERISFKTLGGKWKKNIIISTQWALHGICTAIVYENDDYASTLNFLTNYIWSKKDAAVKLYNWDVEYPSLKSKFPNIEYITEPDHLNRTSGMASMRLQEWLSNISPHNSVQNIQLHVNEFCAIYYNDYVDFQEILMKIIGLPQYTYKTPRYLKKIKERICEE